METHPKDLSHSLHIPDSFEGYGKHMFCLPKHYEEHLGRVVIPSGLIQDRIEKVAANIYHNVINSKTGGITAVCILKGGYRFYSDLLNKINMFNSTNTQSVQITIEFLRAKSYVNTESVGEVSLIGAENLAAVLEGRNILIVEDMIDTGRTMRYLLQKVLSFKPKSVAVAALLKKRTPLSNGYIPDYLAFDIPNEFLVGYALDYNEHFRDLPHICSMSQSGKEKFKQKS